MVKEKISSLYHKNKFLLNRSTKTHYSWLFTREFELVRSLDSKRIIIKVKLNIHIVGAWSIVSRFRKSQLKMLSPTTKVLPVWRDLSIFKPNVLHQMQILSYSNLSQRSSIPASLPSIYCSTRNASSDNAENYSIQWKSICISLVSWTTFYSHTQNINCKADFPFYYTSNLGGSEGGKET